MSLIKYPSTIIAPSSYSEIYSKNQIADRIIELGRLISPWLEEAQRATGSDVLVIPVLRGGIFFFADLVRAFTTSIEVVPIRAVGYDPKCNSLAEGGAKLLDQAPSVEGRSVLLIDDICESGRTFELINSLLKRNGALEVKSAALIKRKVASCTFEPTWVGFHFEGTEWLVGYGMDDSEKWRNLPSIYSMPPRN